MKKIKALSLLLATVAMLLVFTACDGTASTTKPNSGNSSTKPSSGNSSTNSATSELVVYDENGVKIIYTGLDKNSNYFGWQLKFRVENTSGQDLTISSKKVSVNGWTLNASSFYVDVGNNEKATENILIWNSDLKDKNIVSLKDLDVTFHAYNSDTWKDYISSDEFGIIWK